MLTILARVFCLSAFLVLVALPSAQAAMTRAELREALTQILKEHPELVLDVLRSNSETVLEIAQQGNVLRQQKAMRAQWEKDAATPKNPDLAERPFYGPTDAPVTIVAYSDFTCPYCRQAEATLKTLLKAFPRDIRFTFKALPKEDSPLSLAAAKYATAAFMQDEQKGWVFYEDLFSGDGLDREGEDFLKTAAAKAGFDFRKLRADAGSQKVQQRIAADNKEADRLGISGTPYFLVNDLMVRGAVSRERFEEAVEMALKLKREGKR